MRQQRFTLVLLGVFRKSALFPISSYSHIIQLQFAAHAPLVKKYYSKQSRCPMIQGHRAALIRLGELGFNARSPIGTRMFVASLNSFLLVPTSTRYSIPNLAIFLFHLALEINAIMR
jgi:hypothetical protein